MKKIPSAKQARTDRSQFSVIHNQFHEQAPVLPKFASVHHLVKRMKPSQPVHCIRTHAVEIAAKWFVSSFPGHVMYAVKTNPEPVILKAIFNSGITHFDVASLAEIELVAKECPEATMHFMHPVKSREAIMFAYNKFGVRSFSLDSLDELAKIKKMTNDARDLTLHVRIAVSNHSAAYSLQGKFGVKDEEAVKLLRATRKVAKSLGICFHVGSQCMNSEDYSKAIEKSRLLINQARVKVDSIDVGGGFPSIYPDLAPAALQSYMDVISEALQANGFNNKKYTVLCEPGRAIVAESGSLVVKVELRKGNALYINDGVYGGLFDAGHPGFTYPTSAVRMSGGFSGQMEEFRFFGPTCDSLDVMKGPFMLPSDIREGDWIEIGGLGAYSKTIQTRFNGFYSDKLAELTDSPMLSMYGL